MIVSYLFSSPEGDIPATAHELGRPFLMGPCKPHPSLTLRDYFEAIKDFLLMDQGLPLVALLKKRAETSLGLDSISKIRIRSEKHGASSHVASAEILAGRATAKLCIASAISMEGEARLSREFDVLKTLHQTFGYGYLPRPFFRGRVRSLAPHGKEFFFMSLSEWFDGYYEWHLSYDHKEGEQRLKLWDLEGGYRFISEKEAAHVVREASKILTLYYDTRNFHQIYPWHHGAGDFVVKADNESVDVRLTTARGYDRLMVFTAQEDPNPAVALIYFFLDLSVRMRLDKLDGMGELTWAGGFSVQATTEGFFDALKIKVAEKKYLLGDLGDLLTLLKSFDQKEMQRLFYPLLECYEQTDETDFPVIMINMEDHIMQLHRAIQNFQL